MARISRRGILALAGAASAAVGGLVVAGSQRSWLGATSGGSVTTRGESPFPGSVLLGRPTATSIDLSLLANGARESVIEYAASDAPAEQSRAITLTGGEPGLVRLTGLRAGAAYRYRVLHRQPGEGPFLAGPESRFQTARAAGEPFVFTIQADSHRDDNSNAALYQQTLRNIRADQPDFHIDLGDSFMCDKFARSNADVVKRYAEERTWFGAISDTVPLFLVNGNHEGESGWDLNGTEQCLPVWAARARVRYYLNPTPDAYYTGDPVDEPFVGKRASYYAWQWGDAHLIVMDPFWFTKMKPRNNDDLWNWTLGERQYRWLVETLASSRAKYRFVFIHHLVGGIDPSARGGVEAAGLWEWGGRSRNGASQFAARRPGWSAPIHDLLVKHRVNAVFHGHDHVYVQQELDGIVYQEAPQPSHLGENGAQLAAEGSYRQGKVLSSSGHLRVTVGPERATIDYLKTAGSGAAVAHSYSV